MKCKVWVAAGVVLCVLSAAGCGNIPGNGTGLEGEWAGSLALLFTAANIDLPIPVSPVAQLVFDNGAVTVTLKPDIPVISWVFGVVVDGTSTTDSSTSLDKMSLLLGEASVKFLWFKFPLKDLALATQCIYTIRDLNALYIYPGYDKLPDTVRAAFEAAPQDIPWTGVTFNGVAYGALKLDRVT
jgi:hypothetical protein